MTETRDHWLHDFFDELAIPAGRRKACARACIAWWQSEGGATFGLPWHGAETKWNPFNTTKKMPGSTNQPGNSIPVQVYPTRAVGMAATLSTIREGQYDTIRKKMKADGASAHAICKAIYLSPWGTGQLIFAVLEDIVDRGLYWDYARKIVYPS